VSDWELLFLVLLLLYGWECGCWVRRGSVAFSSWLGRRWRIMHPATLLGNQQGGFVFAQPLPPLGVLLTANQFPLALSPEAVFAFVATSVNPGWRPPQTGNLFRFDEIQTVTTSGKKVLVNGTLLLKTTSPTYAEHLARHLQRLVKLAPKHRAGAIREIFRSSLDTRALRRKWREYQQQAATLRRLANLLFGYLFVVAPAVIWTFGFRQCWLPLLIGLLAFTISIALEFRRIHKALYPSATDERFTHFLTTMLAPATTIRAHDMLSRPLLEMFHPLAIAKVFCDETRFREFARRVLLDIRHPCLPVCSRAEPMAQAAEGHGRAALQKAVEEFLKRNGADPANLARPPAPADETCRSYCPRCLAQFTAENGECADCGGLPLMAFGANQKAVTAGQESRH
jgi:hypothetical protein